VQHVFVAPPPEQVYRALTDPTQHGAVTGTVVTGEPIEGGTFTASSGYIHGTFEKLEENKLVVQTWTTTEWPKGAGPSRLELAFEAADGGTELTMTHSEVPLSQAESYRQGWIDYYWNPLRAHFGKA
jgi:activator of HSP90 ATPase